MMTSDGSAAAASPPRPAYAPVTPPAAERRRAALRQAVRLPSTLVAIFRNLAEDFEVAALDEHVWSFRGFHDGADDPHYRARQWRKVRLSAIAPRDVSGIPAWEMAFMANVAREIEEPILEYSHQNGEGLRFLLPSLARFLGKNHEEAAYAAAHGLAWCESPWCEEERRHATTFARIIERLTDTSPAGDNPNRPKVVTSSEADAVRLVISRQAAEWNSSSTYTVMAVHATGDLHHALRNLARDEIKHLAILGAADRYLFGRRPWQRFGVLVRQGLDEYRAQRHRRSGGDLMGINPVTALEVVAAHLLEEFFIRRWLETLPLPTLEAVFEAPSSLPELAAAAAPPDRRAALEGIVRTGQEKRANLSRWAPRERERASARRAFEADHAREIEETVHHEFDGFRGAESPGSRRDRDARKKIRTFRGTFSRACLTGPPPGPPGPEQPTRAGPPPTVTRPVPDSRSTARSARLTGAGALDEIGCREGAMMVSRPKAVSIPRRRFLAGGLSAGALAIAPSTHAQPRGGAPPGTAEGDLPRRLREAVRAPVLRRELFPRAVTLQSVELLRNGRFFLVRARSADGATGLAEGHADVLRSAHPILLQRVAPFFAGKDARDLDALLDGVYVDQSNYKWQGLPFWACVASVELAILDLLGQVSGKPIGDLLGSVRRREIAVYRASSHRGNAPEEELEYLQRVVEETGRRPSSSVSAAACATTRRPRAAITRSSG